MNRVERDARLLCEARYLAGNQKLGREIDAAEMQRYVDLSWDDVRFTTRAEDMAAAGLTFAKIEPSEETVDEMAVELRALAFDTRPVSLASVLRFALGDDALVKEALRIIARAAYRAAVGEG